MQIDELITYETSDLRIKALHSLYPPTLLIKELPITHEITHLILNTRKAIQAIIRGEDDRLLVVVGPCSIHDPSAAIEYASRLKSCITQYTQELCIIMRVYFEKPRTTIGWKGLINDPHLDASFDINHGLRIARGLLLKINALGVPTGSEFLDVTIPQYISDLTAWTAIGARTTESQIHRELASGLSMPVGFKNGTRGSIQIAIDAMLAASHPHHFLGISKEGSAAILATQGNHDTHLILRGSTRGPNFDPASIQNAVKKLKLAHLTESVMVDCSHGNSNKDYRKQIQVIQSLSQQIRDGNFYLQGVMIESHLLEGKQLLKPGKPLIYGKSITDACISWENTQQALYELAEAVTIRRQCNSGTITQYFPV